MEVIKPSKKKIKLSIDVKIEKKNYIKNPYINFIKTYSLKEQYQKKYKINIS